MAWGQRGILSRPENQLAHMEHDVGKETECETSAMSRGRRNFLAAQPNKVWLTNIPYIPTRVGSL
jgi:hypothetical protein